ncbi:MAG: 23S rRNA (uridine(2552)-2'-O)-methyltransferase RlmE [Pseudomonadota bacterium]
MSRSRSSKRWLKEHFDDPYVKRAQAEGYRSRAAFKLIELQERFSLARRGNRVVDLGAAPGGWCQLAVDWVGPKGAVFGLDLLPVDPMPGVALIEGDFTEDEPLAALEALLDGHGVDLVLSDMAPNISGMVAVDQPRAMYLAELALDFVRQHLNKGGRFAVKVFQGEGFDAFLADVRGCFDKVRVVKPKASRPRSREVYLVAHGFHGPSG